MTVMISCVILAALWIGVFLSIRSLRSIDLGRRFKALAGRGRDAAERTAPFKAFRKLALRRKKEKLIDELAQSLAYTRNIAILGGRGRIGAQDLLSELAAQAKLLRPVFRDMAHSLNLNDKARAQEALYSVIREGYAKDVGTFLSSWEDIDPNALIQTIEVYRSMLLEDRITRIKRRDEMISDLVYLPVVLNCIVVLLNFLYVAYFLEQKEVLALFF